MMAAEGLSIVITDSDFVGWIKLVLSIDLNTVSLWFSSRILGSEFQFADCMFGKVISDVELKLQRSSC